MAVEMIDQALLQLGKELTCSIWYAQCSQLAHHQQRPCLLNRVIIPLQFEHNPFAQC